MEAAFEVQRTIKRAELTAFLCLLKKIIGPMKALFVLDQRTSFFSIFLLLPTS